MFLRGCKLAHCRRPTPYHQYIIIIIIITVYSRRRHHRTRFINHINNYLTGVLFSIMSYIMPVTVGVSDVGGWATRGTFKMIDWLCIIIIITTVWYLPTLTAILLLLLLQHSIRDTVVRFILLSRAIEFIPNDVILGDQPEIDGFD